MHLRPGRDPARVIDRARMGAALAYGTKLRPVEPRLGRPLCQECHERQGAKDNALHERFSIYRREVTVLHNSYANSPLALPDRADYP
jgi:hypothetical protein